jgi:uncharacterized membrane protein YfcA
LQVLPQALEERVAHLALRRFGAVLDLGEQLWLDPDALVRDALGVGLPLALLFGADVKLAGSLSLAVSLPTMLVGFARYSRDQSFSVLRANWPFMLAMAAGSMTGTFIGSLLLGIVPSSILLPGLAAILVISAAKVWRHE